MNKKIVTILIPHYKTYKLTQLCLRLIKKNSDLDKIKVIVIDNNSCDESVEYLRSLKWITLIERKGSPDDTPPLSHSRALDSALQLIDTPYVLSLHTDTLIKRNDWLDFLLKKFTDDTNVAAVGSWKLEQKSFMENLAKTLEKYIQLLWYKIINKKQHAIAGISKNYYYLRSHCALFRTDLLKKFSLTFSAQEEVAGKVMCKTLENNGFKLIYLPSNELLKYMEHVNHATSFLNPEFSSRAKTINNGTKRIKNVLAKLNAEEILLNNKLDE